MSPAQRAARLKAIADHVEGAANLVTAADMAVTTIPQPAREAVSELLRAIGCRLDGISQRLTEAEEEERAA